VFVCLRFKLIFPVVLALLQSLTFQSSLLYKYGVPDYGTVPVLLIRSPIIVKTTFNKDSEVNNFRNNKC
jgi:hypothetical protein